MASHNAEYAGTFQCAHCDGWFATLGEVSQCRHGKLCTYCTEELDEVSGVTAPHVGQVGDMIPDNPGYLC